MIATHADTSQVPTPPRREFNRALHLMRGIAILLVVVGHSLGPIQDHYELADTTHRVIYSFHMQLFFFISGFVAIRLFRPGQNSYLPTVARQFKRLVVPYFFYTALGLAAKLAVQGYVHRPVVAGEVLSNVFLYPGQNPLMILWFIYTLFVLQMFFLTWNTLLRMDYSSRIHVVAGLVIVIAMCASAGRVRDMPVAINFAFRHAVYVYLGFLAGRRAAAIESLLQKYARPLLLFGAAYGVFVFLYPSFLDLLWVTRLACALIAIVWVWTLAIQLAERNRVFARLFGRLGDDAYAIYLNGSLFQVAVGIALTKAMGWDPLLVLPIDFLVGLMAPIVLARYLYSRFAILRKLALGNWTS